MRGSSAGPILKPEHVKRCERLPASSGGAAAAIVAGVAYGHALRALELLV